MLILKSIIVQKFKGKVAFGNMKPKSVLNNIDKPLAKHYKNQMFES